MKIKIYIFILTIAILPHSISYGQIDSASNVSIQEDTLALDNTSTKTVNKVIKKELSNEANYDLYSLIVRSLLAFLTLIGILVSIWYSSKTLNESKADRLLASKPIIISEITVLRIPIKFVKAGKAIPGINPNYVAKILSDLPEDIESVRINHEVMQSSGYGKLTNYGLGPALNVETTWIPETVWVGNDSFKIDEKKLEEPIYSAKLNNLPVSPSHINPQNGGYLTRIPTFIEKDVEKKITMVEGKLKIEYEDVFHRKHETIEDFRIVTNYNDNVKTLNFVFNLEPKNTDGNIKG